MKQKPSFQCYQQDILGSVDVQMMTAEEFGCYMLILLNLYNNGGALPSDKNAIKILCRGVEISEKVYAKFYEKNGELRNTRVDIEFQKRKKFSKTQAENAKKRWKNGNAEMMPSHTIGIDSAFNRQCSLSSSSSSNIREEENSTAYTLYREFFPKYQLGLFQTDLLQTAEINEAEFRECLTFWASHGYAEKNIGGLLDCYNSKNYKPKPTKPEPKPEPKVMSGRERAAELDWIQKNTKIIMPTPRNGTKKNDNNQ